MSGPILLNRQILDPMGPLEGGTALRATSFKDIWSDKNTVINLWYVKLKNNLMIKDCGEELPKRNLEKCFTRRNILGREI